MKELFGGGIFEGFFDGGPHSAGDFFKACQQDLTEWAGCAQAVGAGFGEFTF